MIALSNSSSGPSGVINYYLSVNFNIPQPFSYSFTALEFIKHNIKYGYKDYKNLINGDVFFSCLGTTRSEAGGKKNQYLVDYTYQFDFAKMASENNIKIYSLISSLGANENSFFFYPRIKGALEKRIKW